MIRKKMNSSKLTERYQTKTRRNWGQIGKQTQKRKPSTKTPVIRWLIVLSPSYNHVKYPVSSKSRTCVIYANTNRFCESRHLTNSISKPTEFKKELTPSSPFPRFSHRSKNCNLHRSLHTAMASCRFWNRGNFLGHFVPFFGSTRKFTSFSPIRSK